MNIITRKGYSPVQLQDRAVPDVAAAQRRGKVWIALSFVFCPCHLPVTIALLGLLLGGTAAGALLWDNLVLAGTVITLTWVAGTWRGLRLLRTPTACAVPGVRVGPRARLARIVGR